MRFSSTIALSISSPCIFFMIIADMQLSPERTDGFMPSLISQVDRRDMNQDLLTRTS
jgi:hypothetical protein